MGRRIVEELRGDGAWSGGAAFADFDGERSLSCGRAHDFNRNDLPNKFRLAQAVQPGCCENDRVVFSLLEFAQPRVDVATQGMNIEIGTHGLQLRLPPQAGRSNARRLRQFLKARILARAERVSRIFSCRYGSDFESRRKIGGQVFQRMHREIDASGGERLFNLLREHALGSDLGQSNVGDLVACGVDDFDFNFVSAGT